MIGWWILSCAGTFIAGYGIGKAVGRMNVWEMLSWIAATHANDETLACPACNEVEGHSPGCPLAELAESE